VGIWESVQTIQPFSGVNSARPLVTPRQGEGRSSPFRYYRSAGYKSFPRLLSNGAKRSDWSGRDSRLPRDKPVSDGKKRLVAASLIMTKTMSEKVYFFFHNPDDNSDHLPFVLAALVVADADADMGEASPVASYAATV
jgi:hypothetical protein